MIYLYFEDIKAFLEKEVCALTKLKRPISDDAYAFELAPPVVSIGWPETQLAGPEIHRRVPGIAIGLSGPVSDDGDRRILPIQLALVVYSSGTIQEDGSLNVSDSGGYQDLLNLMDRTVRAIRNAGRIGERLALAGPEIEYRPDNEQYLDFWLGEVSFTLQANAAPDNAEQNLL